MFALGIELLMRRAIITRYDRREEAEWPPHPDRIFMALVAGFGETGESAEEGAALRWLETLTPPSISGSLQTSRRAEYTSYVPVNDDAAPVLKGKPVAPMGGMPLGRVRQPRRFPAVTPESSTLYMRWETEIPSTIRPALESLCEKVTYLGHSATPVRMWVEDADMTPDLVPDGELETQRLRVFGPGRLDYLLARHKAGLRPQPALWRSYGKPQNLDQTIREGPFDPGLLVLRQVGGRKFPLESSGILAEALRDTLMKRKQKDLPGWLTGHNREGAPSKIERPAIMPLAFVNREHADGHLLGLAIALPRNFEIADSRELFDLLLQHDNLSRDSEEDAPFLELAIRDVGTMELELDQRTETQRASTLKLRTWTKPAQEWATITPLILPRFPRRHLSVEEVVLQSVIEAGFPRPCSIDANPAPFLIGVPHSRSFQMKQRPGRPPRPLIHARIKFDVPVRGPVIIGAGRYNGFGTCRPITEEDPR